MATRRSSRSLLQAPQATSPDGVPVADLAPIVGANLRRLRTRRNLSLEGLATLSGVSRAMLGQIELGQSAPTINVLWKIARALEVTFSSLIASRDEGGAQVLRGASAKLLTSADGAFTSRALFPIAGPRRVEFYRLTLAAGATEVAEPHPPGTSENLVVEHGSLVLEEIGGTHELSVGDAILFAADVPHTYRNPGSTDAIMFLVMTYAEEVG